MKSIKFDFTKTSSKLLWIKIIKNIYNLTAIDAKKIIDNGNYTTNIEEKYIESIKMILRNNLSNIGYEREIQVMSIKEKSNDIQEIRQNVIKVGSVYILTEEEYTYLERCRGLLTDLLGTIKNFTRTYEQIK